MCSFSFCTKCDDIWHPGELCKELRTEENRRMLKLQRQQAEGSFMQLNKNDFTDKTMNINENIMRAKPSLPLL